MIRSRLFRILLLIGMVTILSNCSVLPPRETSSIVLPAGRPCPPLYGPDAQFYRHYSRKWGICLDGTENPQLITTVDRWLGTRYKYGGCSRRGVDCSCLVKSIYREVYGIELKRTSADIFHQDLTPINTRRLREGDILSFKTRGNRISHIGIYLKDGKFVHASQSKGVMINDIHEPYYRKRFYGAGRYL